VTSQLLATGYSLLYSLIADLVFQKAKSTTETGNPPEEVGVRRTNSH